MEAQSYRVEGTFRIDGAWKPYKKVISAPNEKQARERVFTLLGSKHRLEAPRHPGRKGRALRG